MYILNRDPLKHTLAYNNYCSACVFIKIGDIEFGSHFEKWPSPRYAQFLKCPPIRILKPYVYITQINSKTSIPPKCLRAYRAGPGLCDRPTMQTLIGHLILCILDMHTTTAMCHAYPKLGVYL